MRAWTVPFVFLGWMWASGRASAWTVEPNAPGRAIGGPALLDPWCEEARLAIIAPHYKRSASIEPSELGGHILLTLHQPDVVCELDADIACCERAVRQTWARSTLQSSSEVVRTACLHVDDDTQMMGLPLPSAVRAGETVELITELFSDERCTALLHTIEETLQVHAPTPVSDPINHDWPRAIQLDIEAPGEVSERERLQLVVRLSGARPPAGTNLFVRVFGQGVDTGGAPCLPWRGDSYRAPYTIDELEPGILKTFFTVQVFAGPACVGQPVISLDGESTTVVHEPLLAKVCAAIFGAVAIAFAAWTKWRARS